MRYVVRDAIIECAKGEHVLISCVSEESRGDLLRILREEIAALPPLERSVVEAGIRKGGTIAPRVTGGAS